ncbi:hypothetical protein ACFL2K_01080, partial [Candidatus Margulisiibacteriota bacterium]
YVIANNHFFDGSGSYAIYVNESRGGTISGNQIQECSLSTAINIAGSSASSITQSVTISANSIYDCTFMRGISCNLFTSYPPNEEGALIIGNNIHDNSHNLSIVAIWAADNGTVVNGNQICDLECTGTEPVTGITSSFTGGTVTGNVIRNLKGSRSVMGIENAGCNVLNSNAIDFTVASSYSVWGIYNHNYGVTDGLVITGNRIRVSNTVSGTGYAFYVDMANGCAIANSWLGSEAMGTLNLGQVFHNDG